MASCGQGEGRISTAEHGARDTQEKHLLGPA